VSPTSTDGYYAEGTLLTVTPSATSNARFRDWFGRPSMSTCREQLRPRPTGPCSAPAQTRLATPLYLTGNFELLSPLRLRRSRRQVQPRSRTGPALRPALLHQAKSSHSMAPILDLRELFPRPRASTDFWTTASTRPRSFRRVARASGLQLAGPGGVIVRIRWRVSLRRR